MKRLFPLRKRERGKKERNSRNCAQRRKRERRDKEEKQHDDIVSTECTRHITRRVDDTWSRCDAHLWHVECSILYAAWKLTHVWDFNSRKDQPVRDSGTLKKLSCQWRVLSSHQDLISCNYIRIFLVLLLRLEK